MVTMDTFWLSCLKRFETELNAQQFNTWIKPLQLSLSSAHNELILVAPNRFVLQWIKDNFLPRIEQMAENHFSRNIHFQLKLADNVLEKTTTTIEKDGASTPPPLATIKNPPTLRIPPPQKNKSRQKKSSPSSTFMT